MLTDKTARKMAAGPGGSPWPRPMQWIDGFGLKEVERSYRLRKVPHRLTDDGYRSVSHDSIKEPCSIEVDRFVVNCGSETITIPSLLVKSITHGSE